MISHGRILANVEDGLTENLSTKLGYRYFATEDIEIRRREIEYSAQGIETGIRVTF